MDSNQKQSGHGSAVAEQAGQEFIVNVEVPEYPVGQIHDRRLGDATTDSEKITQTLTGKAPSQKEAEALTKLFQEIFAAYHNGAEGAVAGELQRQLIALKDNFETAYSRLQKKMGL
jgi:hypothetical protein